MDSKNTDVIDLEASRCQSAYEYILKSRNVRKAKQILANLIKQLKENINEDSIELNTEYENTITLNDQATYPGDLELESKMELVRSLEETGRRVRVKAKRRQRLPSNEGWIVGGPDLIMRFPNFDSTEKSPVASTTGRLLYEISIARN